MIVKKIIGYLILIVIFGKLFYLTMKPILKEITITFVAIILITGLIIVAINLITDD